MSEFCLMTVASKNSVFLDKVVSLYDIKRPVFMENEKGYRNRSYRFKTNANFANLIIYKNEPLIEKKIKIANRVSDYLAQQGFPSRRTLDPRVVRIESIKEIRYASLYEYLPGEVIPWEAYTSRHLKLLGCEMARMHALLSSLKKEYLPDIEDELALTTARMRHYFSDSIIQEAMVHKLQIGIDTDVFDLYDHLFIKAKRINKRQPLHMDFVRGNILFTGDKESLKISGVIDFEKAAFGHRVFDIARTLAFLYVDSKFKNHNEVFKKFLISGYIRSGKGRIKRMILGMPDKKVDLLESLVEFYWLHDLYKFMRHNPYESLHQNEHYKRTIDYLLKHKVVYSTSSKRPK